MDLQDSLPVEEEEGENNTERGVGGVGGVGGGGERGEVRKSIHPRVHTVTAATPTRMHNLIHNCHNKQEMRMIIDHQ